LARGRLLGISSSPDWYESSRAACLRDIDGLVGVRAALAVRTKR
jgi:hypothetical protein